jgi:hypothetical protein
MKPGDTITVNGQSLTVVELREDGRVTCRQPHDQGLRYIKPGAFDSPATPTPSGGRKRTDDVVADAQASTEHDANE